MWPPSMSGPFAERTVLLSCTLTERQLTTRAEFPPGLPESFLDLPVSCDVTHHFDD